MRWGFKSEWRPATLEETDAWTAALDEQGIEEVRICLGSRWGHRPNSLLSIGGVWMQSGFAKDWLSYKEWRKRLIRDVNFCAAAVASLILVIAIWTRLY